MSKFHPITFCIPEEKIVDINKISVKTKLLSNLIPGRLETYIYKTEDEYYNEYQTSLFAITKKKGGWDCLRHYEIIANGCIPYFENIQNCPENALFLFQKEWLYESNDLYEKMNNSPNPIVFINDNRAMYLSLINKLMDNLKTSLTTRKMAEYILKVVSPSTLPTKILFLSSCTTPDYLRCLVLHGFKLLFGENCHDYPKIKHIYKDSEIKYNTLYGKGMTYTNLLEQSFHNESFNENVERDIMEHKYDIVIYGSAFRGMPLYDLVNVHYKPEEIILLYGEDIREDGKRFLMSLKEKEHHIFVRE
jgi:hypothetical protein